MEFLVLLVFIYHIFTLLLSILSVKYSATVIFQRSSLAKTIKLSPLITIYFLYILICNFVSAINCLYVICWWRPNENIYDARILYWLGILPWLMFFSQSMIEICLCVDRCFTMLFPIDYNDRKKSYFAFFAVIFLLIGLSIITYINHLLDIQPLTSVSICRYVGCFINVSISKYLLYTKIAITIPNIIFGFILIILIHKVFKNNTNKNIVRMSKTVYFIIAITAAFDFIPVFIADIFKGITGNSLVTYLGPYGITLNACCCNICAKIYSNAFKKSGINNSAVVTLNIPVIVNTK